MINLPAGVLAAEIKRFNMVRALLLVLVQRSGLDTGWRANKVNNKITDFAFCLLRMRVAISRLCPAGPAGFKPRPYGLRRRYVRTPALPAAGPVAPGPPLCPCFCLQRYIIFFKYAKKIQRNFQEIFDFVDIQRVAKGAFSRFSVVKRFNGIMYILCIYKVSGGRALFRAVSDPGGAGIQAGAVHQYQEQSPHDIKPLYVSPADSGRMIDHGRSGKLN